jgi:hypothetical protein
VVFPVKEYEASYTAAYRTRFEQTYTLKFRGSTVVDISERDIRPTSYQLYQRDHLKAGGPAPLRQVTRFAADKLIRNW